MAAIPDRRQRHGQPAVRAPACLNADAALNQAAFNQTITQGANIQFNSMTIRPPVTTSDDHRHWLTSLSGPRGVCRAGFFQSFQFESLQLSMRRCGRARLTTFALKGRLSWRQRLHRDHLAFRRISANLRRYRPRPHRTTMATLAPDSSDDYTTPRPNYFTRCAGRHGDPGGGAGSDAGDSIEFLRPSAEASPYLQDSRS